MKDTTYIQYYKTVRWSCKINTIFAKYELVNYAIETQNKSPSLNLYYFKSMKNCNQL